MLIVPAREAGPRFWLWPRPVAGAAEETTIKAPALNAINNLAFICQTLKVWPRDSSWCRVAALFSGSRVWAARIWDLIFHKSPQD